MLSKQEVELRYRRYISLNKSRLETAFSILNVESKDFLNILPILLHYNDVNLFGYKEDLTSFGIDNFSINETQKDFITKISKGKLPKEPTKCCIHGLYAMGSTSSLGQGSSSDLDIWVCLHKEVSDKDFVLLSDKCKFISTLAHSKGVDLNLFLTKEDRFTSNTSDLLEGDNCGSAQNILLLDEFYRTAIKLAGKDIIWYLVSNKEEQENYNYYVNEIYKLENFSKDKFFDFGSVVNISPQEYFGSALWILYKGLDSPFKATIKILLMESYSNDYPNTLLLCSQFKESMQRSDGYSFALDAYYIMFNRVADYLLHKNDKERFDLLTLCFYIKIYTGLENITNTNILQRKKNLLAEFKRKWKWSEQRISFVENTDTWKVKNIQNLHKRLVDSLVESYRELLRFTVRYNIEYAITSDDASILSRKIYVALDKYQGKIILLPNEFRKTLSEDNITFIKVGNRSLCKKGWHLYTKASTDLDILSSDEIYMSDRIVDMVTWCCFNNIMIDKTNIFVEGHHGIVNKHKIKSLAYDLKRTLLSVKITTDDAELRRPRVVKSALIVLNFESDPTITSEVNMSDLEKSSTLSTGKQKQCLIGSIDIVLINNWGELRTIPIADGELGVIDLLVTLTKIIRSQKDISLDKVINSISVCCYASNNKDLIRYDLEQVIKKLFKLFLNMSKKDYVFNVGKNSYVATLNSIRGFTIRKMRVFGQDDYDLSISSRYGMRPEFFLQIPLIVEQYSTLGVIQFFFTPKRNMWCIYIVNERNEVAIYDNFVGSRTTLVNAINRFYIKATRNFSNYTSRNIFNLPQYFVLNENETEIRPFIISAK